MKIDIAAGIERDHGAVDIEMIAEHEIEIIVIDQVRVGAIGPVLSTAESDPSDHAVGIDIIAECIGSARIAILRIKAPVEAGPRADEIGAFIGDRRPAGPDCRQARQSCGNFGSPSHDPPPAQIVGMKPDQVQVVRRHDGMSQIK